MDNFEFKSIRELVELGHKGRGAMAKYLDSVQAKIGAGNEFHPDWMDTLIDALDELGWDTEEFINLWCCGRLSGVNADG